VKIRRISSAEIEANKNLSLSPRSYLTFRTHTPIDYRGETKTLKEWAAALGQTVQLLRRRLNLGWSVERAFGVGPLPRGRWVVPANRERSQFVTIDGETKRVIDWIRERGLNASTVWMRVGRGESLEQALTRPLHTRRRPNQCSRCCDTGHTKQRCTASIYYSAMRQSGKL